MKCYASFLTVNDLVMAARALGMRNFLAGVAGVSDCRGASASKGLNRNFRTHSKGDGSHAF